MSRIAGALVALLGIGLLLVDVAMLDYFGPFIVIPIALLPLALVGGLLIARIPRNPIGWLLGLSGLAFAVMFATGAYGWSALVARPGNLPAGEIATLVSSVAFPPALGSLVLLLLFFPSGRGLGGRWVWLERGMILLIFTITMTALFKDVPIQIAAPLTEGSGPNGRFIPNPLAQHGPLGAVITALAPLGTSASAPVVLLGPLSLIVRYRRSKTTEREQIKWLAYSGTISFGLLVASNVVPSEIADWTWGIGAMTLGLFPIAIGVAILRYRLYDIDLIIRRTLVYAAVSATLLAAYVGGVALFQRLLAPVTEGNGAAVAISTLAVVALFQPVRRRIGSAVDRRFYRSRYDAERTLEAFSTRLRDEVDLDAVRHDLVSAAQRTVQPAHASVWIRGEGR